MCLGRFARFLCDYMWRLEQIVEELKCRQGKILKERNWTGILLNDAIEMKYQMQNMQTK